MHAKTDKSLIKLLSFLVIASIRGASHIHSHLSGLAKWPVTRLYGFSTYYIIYYTGSSSYEKPTIIEKVYRSMLPIGDVNCIDVPTELAQGDIPRVCTFSHAFGPNVSVIGSHAVIVQR